MREFIQYIRDSVEEASVVHKTYKIEQSKFDKKWYVSQYVSKHPATGKDMYVTILDGYANKEQAEEKLKELEQGGSVDDKLENPIE